MTFLLLIVWIYTGKKKGGGGCYFCYIWLFISFSRISSSKLWPNQPISKIKDLNISYSFSFLKVLLSKKTQKNDSSYLCNIFFCNGKDRFTFLTTISQRLHRHFVCFFSLYHVPWCLYSVWNQVYDTYFICIMNGMMYHPTLTYLLTLFSPLESF